MNIPKRHGDVNFHPVAKAEGEIIKHNGSFIVELGERTGHKHVLKVKNPDELVIRKDSKGNFYFELLAEGTFTHEEHKIITIQPGIYKKINEREIDHFSGSVNRVID